jgi:small GTP-binding protein
LNELNVILSILYEDERFALSSLEMSFHRTKGYKVVLGGDQDVGKTSVISWLIQRRFVGVFHNTVGASAHDWTTEVQGTDYLIRLWDTAGGERYRSLAPIYFRDAKAAVLVFDASGPDPKESIEQWLGLYYSVNDRSSCVVVAANKSDLVSDRVALEETIARLKAHFNLDFFVVSAKTGEGIPALFQHVAAKLVERFSPLSSGIVFEPKESKCLC